MFNWISGKASNYNLSWKLNLQRNGWNVENENLIKKKRTENQDWLKEMFSVHFSNMHIIWYTKTLFASAIPTGLINCWSEFNNILSSDYQDWKTIMSSNLFNCFHWNGTGYIHCSSLVWVGGPTNYSVNPNLLSWGWLFSTHLWKAAWNVVFHWRSSEF